MRTALLAVAAALAVSALSPARAVVANEEPQTVCAMDEPVTAKLVVDARGNDIDGLQAIAGRDDMLVGHLSAMREPQEDTERASGTVIFIKRAASWRAVIPQNFESEVGVYATANGDAMALLTQRQIEGPGQSFTFVRTDDDFATAACTEIKFPAALNQPTWNNEFLEPHDLDIKRSGAGTLIAFAALERSGETPRTLWFAYTTRDNGHTWAPPVALSGARTAPAGLYAPATKTSAPALVADLTAYAQGK